MVCRKASFHCVPFNLSTSPESSAATKTPVPAADNQLMANRAASGLAFTGATGGMRWTRLLSDGISQTGSESVPPKGDPSRVVLNLISEKSPFRYVLKAGMPQMAQHATRITHGIHAWT